MEPEMFDLQHNLINNYIETIEQEITEQGIKIGWGLTYKCNMKCSFCYSWKLRELEKYDWTFDEVKNFLELNSDNVNDINWGTGENVLLPNFGKICEMVKDDNISQSITTNGSIALLNPSLQDSIMSNIDEVDVSIDYSSPEKHNNNRGYSKAFKIAIKSLKLANEYNLTPTIVSVLFKDNATVENFLQLAEIAKKYNAFLRINLLVPTTLELLNKMIDPLKIAEIFSELAEKLSIVSISDDYIAKFLRLDTILSKSYKRWTSYPGYSYRILPKGQITPNTYLINDNWYIDNVKGNTIKMDLKKIITSPNVRKFIQCKIQNIQNLMNLKSIFGNGAFERQALYDGLDPYHKESNFLGVSFNKKYLEKIQKVQNKLDEIEIQQSAKGKETIHSEYLATNIFECK